MSTSITSAHLHTYSHYSVGEGLSSPMEMATESGEGSALAITDKDTLAGCVKHARACASKGVKPIWGVDLTVESLGSVVLLAANDVGFANMLELIGTGATKSSLAEHSDGLFCLTGHTSGPAWRAFGTRDKKAVKSILSPLVDAFGDRLIFESSNRGMTEHAEFERFVGKVAKHYGGRVAHTQLSRYARPDQKVSHAVMVADHFKKKVHEPELACARWPDAHLVRGWSDPVSIEVAQDCHFELDVKVPPILPQANAPVSMRGMSAEKILYKLGRAGLGARNIPLKDRPVYQERFRHEYRVICEMGFAGYFLIVADYVAFARSAGFLVGPGRGSGVGSLMAWVLGITQLDPIEYGLFFERFLNPERKSMPDFDVDFPRSGRRAVIEYVQATYGDESVMSCATYGEMRAKSAFAAAARVVGVVAPDAIAFGKRFIDDDKPAGSREFTSTGARDHLTPRIEKALDLAAGLAGAHHSVGQHAGGIFITPGKSRAIAPSTPDGVCQLDHYDAEALGLVKFDFLGLKELDVLMYVSEMIGEEIDFEKIDLSDPGIYEVIGNGDTLGVFQMAGWGFSSTLKRMKPEVMQDLTAAVALYRPGPKDAGMIDIWINRRHGISPVSYPHPDLEPILKETYGVIIYQEQVMKIVQVMGGFSLGKADIMRRGMGKKIQSVVDGLKAEFLEGARAKGYTEEVAGDVWDQMATFANYGFNKCVMGGTLVRMADGSERKIEDVNPGDSVSSRDESTGQDVAVDVVERHFNGKKKVFRYTLDNGTEITCTRDHKFRTTCGLMLPIHAIASMGLDIVAPVARSTPRTAA